MGKVGSVLLVLGVMASASASAQPRAMRGTFEVVSPLMRSLVMLDIGIGRLGPVVRAWAAQRPPLELPTTEATFYYPYQRGDARGLGVLTFRTSPRDLFVVAPASGGNLLVTLLGRSGARRTVVTDTFRRKISRPDCHNYNPASLRLLGNRVAAGRELLLAFSTREAALEGLLLTRAYSRQCIVGKGNLRRTNRAKYMLDYYEGGMGGRGLPPGDCIGYNPAMLRLAQIPGAWRLDALSPRGTMMLQEFDTYADALAGRNAARRFRQLCYIGRGTAHPYQYLR